MREGGKCPEAIGREHGMDCLSRLPSFLGAALLTLFLRIVVRYCDDVQVEEGVGSQLATVDAHAMRPIRPIRPARQILQPN